MDVALRADSSGQIGTGHLMRCLTLADALRGHGARTTFLMAPSGAPWRDMIAARGHDLKIIEGGAGVDAGAPLAHAAWLPWSQTADAAASLAALDRPVDLMIVDHYALDGRWETALRAKAWRILAIDDIADRRHDCDALLDQNPQNPEIDRYVGLTPQGVQRFIGPRYALLRPQFAAARAARTAQRGTVARIVLFMGGTDEAGATLWMLAALARPEMAHIAVDVVLGGQSRHLAAVRQAVAARPGTTLHVDSADMASLVAAADLALGAGGVAAIERCCLGVPSLAVAVTANQAPALAELARLRATLYLGPAAEKPPEGLQKALIGLINSPETLISMAAHTAAVADGQGIARLVAGLRGILSPLIVRRATMADAERLHRWRNDPKVRAASFNTEPIPFSDHQRWLDGALSNSEQLVLLGVMGEEPVGSVRYRLTGARATVSVMVAPHCWGGGIGRSLLLAGESFLSQEVPTVEAIDAEIRVENAISIKLFEKAGYRRTFEDGARLMYTKGLRKD